MHSQLRAELQLAASREEAEGRDAASRLETQRLRMQARREAAIAEPRAAAAWPPCSRRATAT